MANKFNFKKVQRNSKFALRSIIVLSANEAKNHFVESFRKGGFTDSSLKRWRPRKKIDKRRPGRAVLVDSGDLRKSIRVARVNTQQLNATIATDLPYAEVHNEGQGRMPQRQFIGHSDKLDKAITDIIDKKIDSIFR